MKHTSAELKQMARMNLSGKWGIVISMALLQILILMILYIPSYLFGSVYSISGAIIYLAVSLITSLISGLIEAGVMYFFLNICRGKAYRLSDLFAAFRMHPDRFLIVSLILTLFTLPLDLITFLLPFIWQGSQFYFIIIQSGCTILAYVISLVLSLFFGMSYYILLDFPQMGATAAMGISAKLLKGNKGRYLYLTFSFIGWTLLGALTCGIGLLWVMPYMNMTMAYFYADLLHQLDPPINPEADIPPTSESTTNDFQ